MKIELPEIAESFIRFSNAQDLQGYLSCFTDNATIDDVGEMIEGKKAIADWFTGKDYEYKMEPTEVEESGDTITIKTKVSGTFDGSPANFLLHMKLISRSIEYLKMDFLP